jgi:hypothetical protein
VISYFSLSKLAIFTKAGHESVMRENKPVLLVLSVCDGEIILEKGEILCEKRQQSIKRSLLLTFVSNRGRYNNSWL